MLRPFGYQVESCPPSRLRSGGLFVVDDGDGHAYALRVGEYAVICFRSGTAELLSIPEVDEILAAAAAGTQTIFVASEIGSSPSSTKAPSGSDGSTSREEFDSLCGTGHSYLSKTPGELAAMMRQEVESTLSTLSDTESADAARRDDLWHCPLCPFKTFQRRDKLISHVRNQHAGKSLCGASNKQMRVIHAMWNHSALCQRSASLWTTGGDELGPRSLLSRSAEFIRNGCEGCPSWGEVQHQLTWTDSDRHTALLLDAGERTRFILRSDAGPFHRISDHYYCTNDFLASFLSALLNPDTKGSKKRAWARVKDAAGFTGYLFPDDSAIHLSFVEGLLRHCRIKNMITKCREEADKTVIGIDGQYSTLLSVLYQTQHGASGAERKTGVHVQLSVQCMDSVLLVKPAPSEAFVHAKKALLEAVGSANGAMQVRMICSDAPISLEETALRAAFPRLQCLSKDPLHIALKVEQASGEKRTPLSNLIRRCIVKFSKGLDDGKPYYRGQRRRTDSQSLEDAMSSLSDAAAARAMSAIKAEGYPERPYRNAVSFIKDIASLCHMFPREMGKTTGKKTTVLGSLGYATSPAQLEYLLNLGRFIARNPGVQTMYGTTRNEAFHMQLKAFFRNVFIQTERNARAVSSVCTFAKLLAGWARKSLPLTERHQERELLHAALCALTQHPPKIAPKLRLERSANPQVDVDRLPSSAKVLRRRPAAAAAMPRPRKRPAAASDNALRKRPAAAAVTPRSHKRPASAAFL